MTAAEVKLSDEELDLLTEIAGQRVIYSKGRYRHLVRRADVSHQVQRLRALGLVRRADVGSGNRIPPSRGCELTERGIELRDIHVNGKAG